MSDFVPRVGPPIKAEGLKVGMKVRFHPRIGGRHNGRIYTIFSLNEMHGRRVAILEEENSAVPVEALSELKGARA